MAVSIISVCAFCVLLLVANELYLETAEAFKIHVIHSSRSSSREKALHTTSDQISSVLLSSGTPLFLWGAVRSEDVAAVCQQIVTSGNLTVTVTAVHDQAGLQEELTIKVESFRGCDPSNVDAETEAVVVNEFGHKSLVLCSKKDGLESCEIYHTRSTISTHFHGSRGRILRHGCNGILNCVCFPGDATVQMANGVLKQMLELNVGDEVAVRKQDGRLAYEAIYVFGHKEAEVVTDFVKLTVAPTAAENGPSMGAKSHQNIRSLELSARHFVPTIPKGAGGHVILHKRAEEVKVGDIMWASIGNTDNGEENFQTFIVEEISNTRKAGLYNPYTMEGTIVVNGVVASSHSDWILDALFDSMGITHLLPAAYQVILAPPRMLYRLLGREVYVTVYTWLDGQFNLVSMVRDCSMSVFTILMASALVAPSCIKFLVSSKKQ